MSALFRNTLAQSSSLVSAMIFSFLLAPVMIDRLGLAQFGIWAVTGALAQYARLLDLGITNALSRFVALHDAEGDRRGIEETIGVGLLAAFAVGLLMLGAAVLAAPLVRDVLGVLSTAEMRIVLLSAAAISITLLFDAVLVALPVGLRRMIPPNVAGTAANLVNFVFSLGALIISTELTTYALANVAASVIGVFFTVGAVIYVGSGRLSRRPSLTRTRGILSFGLKGQAVVLANLIDVQTDKLVIAALLGPRTAGAYELANRAVAGVFSLGTMTLSALIPTATADIVQRGKQVIGEYFTRYSVRSLSIALPLFGALCVSVPYVFVLWIGEIPPNTVGIVILLSVTFAVNMTTGVPMTLVVSDGHPGVVAQTAILLVVLNIAATIVAAPLLGLWGVLAATVGAQIVVSAIFLIRFGRRYSFPAAVFSEAMSAPVMVTLLAAVPFGLWYLFGGPIPSERGPALIGTLATGGVYLVVCWLVESRLGLLPETLRVGFLRDRLAGAVRARG
ncbi:MAG: oligosaccharide flippase family protein [Solirubrobacterales bacterium]